MIFVDDIFFLRSEHHKFPLFVSHLLSGLFFFVQNLTQGPKTFVASRTEIVVVEHIW